ncbi:hypothetical protein KC332_g78 [Hortaea werneckii]|nr:hypothetical protein KC332_g78 [Hortaea werneckii]
MLILAPLSLRKLSLTPTKKAIGHSRMETLTWRSPMEAVGGLEGSVVCSATFWRVERSMSNPRRQAVSLL